MSIHALAWAFKQPIDRSSEKLTLLCLCNYADASGYCYPSMATIEVESSLNRKTVLTCIQALIAAGHLRDSGRRVGKTKQIIVYQIVMDLNSAKNGTVHLETVPKTDGNSPVFTIEQSQKRMETVPKTGHGSYQRSVMEPLRDPPTVLNSPKKKMSEEEQERHRADFRRGLADLKANLRK